MSGNGAERPDPRARSEFVAVPVIRSAGAHAPVYKTDGSAGADIMAFIDSAAPLVIAPGERRLVPTGLRIQLPLGYEAQVRSRSGLSIDHGVVCLNSPGTVDSDYRGEIKVILANLGEKPFEIRDGDRIAQLVIAPVTRAAFIDASSLDATERAEGGFGSTGR